jgi:hypothetical protein
VTRAAATGFLGALLVSGFVGLCGTECAFAQIRGTVTDEVGATIHGAKVHVMEADTWKTVRIVKSDSKGRFEIYDLTPGQYKIAFTVRPFKPETLDVDTRAPGADADRSVRLKVLDCDGPGINCDSFFSSTPTPIEDPHPVAFNGSLTLKVDDALDLDHGRIVRDDASGAGVKLTETNGALYLEPLNRTAFLREGDGVIRGQRNLPEDAPRESDEDLSDERCGTVKQRRPDLSGDAQIARAYAARASQPFIVLASTRPAC